MPLLIQGPRQFGNDINVFLEPVIDELVEMWEMGVKDVWDEYKKEHVTIKVVLIAIIIDLPGRGYLSGEKTKGYTRYVECLDDTNAVHLMEYKIHIDYLHRKIGNTLFRTRALMWPSASTSLSLITNCL
jgi:hypothetical protein